MPPSPATSVRSLDWRFLLPAPRGSSFEHLVLLGGSKGDDSLVRDLGLARRVSTAADRSDPADAMIVLADATDSFEAAAQSLAPEGVFYWEIDRRQLGHVATTPRRAERRLKSLGLSMANAFWVKPGFPNRQMYLPLAARGAFDWYLKTLYRSVSPARRVLKGGLRAVAAGGALGTVAPCYAIVGARDWPRRPAIVEHACREQVSGGNPLVPVVLAHGGAEWSRVAVLLFEPGCRTPVCALKFPRQPAFNRQVEWEHMLLRQLAWRLNPAMRSSIPSSSLFYWNELAVAVETCVSGATLSSRVAGSSSRRAAGDLRLAIEWLADFQDATAVERVPAGAWLTARLVNGLCRDFVATFGATNAERLLFARLSRHLASASLGTMPIVWQHTDFGPWNVYRDGDRLSVIDWEVARRGSGLADLLYFVTHWSTAVAGRTDAGERLEHFESLFFAPNETALSAAIHHGLSEYMRRADITASLLPHLLIYMVLEQALDRARRFSTMEFGDASSREGNRYIGYLEVLTRRVEQLFPAEVPCAA